MNINIFNISLNLPSVAVGGITGVILTLITKIGNVFIEDFSKKSEAMWKRKNRLADQIIEICTEGSFVAFSKMPNNQRRIQHLANLVEGIDKTIADELRKYLGLWVLCAIEQTPGPYFKKNPTTEILNFVSIFKDKLPFLKIRY